MRDSFHRFMPYVFGGALGWFLFNPPDWIAGTGPARWLVTGALAGLLLVSVVALLILANLPADPRLEPLPHSELDAELTAQAEALRRLGFVEAGPPLRVPVAPAATMLGFVHPAEPIYAAIFRTGTVPAKTGCDLVTLFEVDGGGLTTHEHPEGASLPADARTLRQVMPGTTIEQRFEAHRRALVFLSSHDVAFRAVSGGSFRQDFLESMVRQRRTFLARPIRNTLVTLWRAASKQVPGVGPLDGQPGIEAALARLGR